MDLVTGATGHIGNVLVRQLLRGGRRVRALVRPGGDPPALRGLGVALVPGDLLHPPALEAALEGVETVYHLAARISLSPLPDPETDRVNLEGTRALLEAARRAGVRRLVYASSIYALRPPVSGPIDENCPFDPASARGAYDRSKALASLEVLRAAAEGLEAVLVLPTAVTGPYDFKRSEAGRGILYHSTSGIKFNVAGAYDFVDVRDVAWGMVRAAGCGRSGEAYILGGERLTVRQVAEIVWEAVGGWHLGIDLPDWVADLAAEVVPFFSDDPIVTPYALGALRSNSFICHDKAARELGYRPRPARQAIADAAAWWQARLEGDEPLPEAAPRSPAADRA